MQEEPVMAMLLMVAFGSAVEADAFLVAEAEKPSRSNRSMFANKNQRSGTGAEKAPVLSNHQNQFD
ncbi:MAG: hypothetical protein AAGA53_12840 [Pseudomonadota bacterium]